METALLLCLWEWAPRCGLAGPLYLPPKEPGFAPEGTLLSRRDLKLQFLCSRFRARSGMEEVTGSDETQVRFDVQPSCQCHWKGPMMGVTHLSAVGCSMHAGSTPSFKLLGIPSQPSCWHFSVPSQPSPCLITPVSSSIQFSSASIDCGAVTYPLYSSLEDLS